MWPSYILSANINSILIFILNLILLSVTNAKNNSDIVSAVKRTRSDLNQVEQRIKKLVAETARYAFNYIPGASGIFQGSSTNSSMAATAVVDMVSHIRDPFKHGVTSAVLAGLYIAALISLIVFAITGTIAFICSFTDCRNFFLGVKHEGSSRPFGSGPVFFKRRDNMHRWNEMQPVIQALHESFDKFSERQ